MMLLLVLKRRRIALGAAPMLGFTLVLLGGCGATLPERVEVPVPVSCVERRPERPTFATDQLKPGASVHDKTKAVLAERHQLRGYVGELEAVVTACEGVSR